MQLADDDDEDNDDDGGNGDDDAREFLKVCWLTLRNIVKRSPPP